MFTIKFYGNNGYRQRIMEAESFTILRGGDDGGAEITLHQKNQNDDRRIDVGPDVPRQTYEPPLYQRAIIENAAGKTTEIINASLPSVRSTTSEFKMPEVVSHTTQ